jgi:hypothetical protein
MSFLKALAGGVIAFFGASLLIGGAGGDGTLSVIGLIIFVVGLLYGIYEFRH